MPCIRRNAVVFPRGQGRDTTKRKRIQELTSEVSAFVNACLHRLTDGAARQMWWTRVGFYHYITVRHNLVIVGWPKRVKFIRPSRAGYSLNVLTNLLVGWRTGRIKFRWVDDVEVRRLGKQIGPKPARSPRYMDQRYQLRDVETRAEHKDVRYHLSSYRYVREDTPEV